MNFKTGLGYSEVLERGNLRERNNLRDAIVKYFQRNESHSIKLRLQLLLNPKKLKMRTMDSFAKYGGNKLPQKGTTHQLRNQR
jgi:hypothetical protein